MKLLVLCAALFSFSLPAEELTKVRIGWLTSWPVQGQLMQIWKHTDILKKNGIEAVFTGKQMGPQLIELALSGAADVVTAGDHSAITIFAADKGWKGIARLQYGRTMVYVPVNSGLKSIKDLKGKTIGVPIGSSAEQDLIAALKKEMLDPSKDVKLVNMGIPEQAELGSKPAWDKIDAMAGYDPVPAILEVKGRARKISEEKLVGVLLANESFLKKNKDIEQKLNKALADAYRYYAKNQKEADGWFLAEASFKDPDHKICDLSASVEPNLKSTTIQTKLGPLDLKSLQETADFMQPQLKKHLDVNKYVVK